MDTHKTTIRVKMPSEDHDISICCAQMGGSLVMGTSERFATIEVWDLMTFAQLANQVTQMSDGSYGPTRIS